MVNITLTDANPGIEKASGGGGLYPVVLVEANPAVVKAAGGGSKKQLLLHDHSPSLNRNRAYGGLSPIFEEILNVR